MRGFTHRTMECLLSAVTSDGKFAGTGWDFWVCLGWAGNAVFGSRFFVQWWATERQKRVVVPTVFWWLSLAGSGLLLIYGIHRKDLVFVFAYLFNWIPYIRSLMIGHRMKRAEVQCGSCQTFSPGAAKFCAHCGAKLELPRAAGQGAGVHCN
jgi:lipid-A-disaccharide synthase-like uncharacterized protein